MNPDKKYFVYNRMSSLFLKDKNFPHVLEISDKDYSQAKFTKEELAEVLDGALYRLPIIQYNSGRICPKEEIDQILWENSDKLPDTLNGLTLSLSLCLWRTENESSKLYKMQ